MSFPLYSVWNYLHYIITIHTSLASRNGDTKYILAWILISMILVWVSITAQLIKTTLRLVLHYMSGCSRSDASGRGERAAILRQDPPSARVDGVP